MKKATQGFALISAIFILVVLALVALYMVRFSSLSFASVNLGFDGVRAFYAAKSGLEWGVRGAVISGTCPATTTVTFTQGELAGYTAVVTCTSISVTESSTYNVYTLNSQGQRGTVGSQDYVSRRLSTEVIQ